MMMMGVIRLNTWQSSQPLLGVGGGASGDRYHGRYVVRQGRLAPAASTLPVRLIPSSLCLAFVPVKVGDVVVEACGRLPVRRETMTVGAWKIIALTRDYLGWDIARVDEVDVGRVMKTAVKGMSLHGNEDARYFCRGDEESEESEESEEGEEA